MEQTLIGDVCVLQTPNGKQIRQMYPKKCQDDKQTVMKRKVMVNDLTNNNKTTESLNNDGQQFHQYQQHKTKFKQ